MFFFGLMPSWLCSIASGARLRFAYVLDSFVGKDDFFLGKVSKICSGSKLLLFWGLTFDFFFSSVHFLEKTKIKSTIEQESVKVTKNLIDF